AAGVLCCSLPGLLEEVERLRVDFIIQRGAWSSLQAPRQRWNLEEDVQVLQERSLVLLFYVSTCPAQNTQSVLPLYYTDRSITFCNSRMLPGQGYASINSPRAGTARSRVQRG